MQGAGFILSKENCLADPYIGPAPELQIVNSRGHPFTGVFSSIPEIVCAARDAIAVDKPLAEVHVIHAGDSEEKEIRVEVIEEEKSGYHQGRAWMGVELSSMNEAQADYFRAREGALVDEVLARVIRRGKKKKITVTLGEKLASRSLLGEVDYFLQCLPEKVENFSWEFLGHEDEIEALRRELDELRKKVEELGKAR